jgi:hypothetical protein
MHLSDIRLIVLLRLPVIVSGVFSALLVTLCRKSNKHRPKGVKRMSLESYFRHALQFKRMRWLAPASAVCAVAALLLFAPTRPAQGQTVLTQVTLSCNDGHSVIFQADQITLTSLLADVQAINASGTGTLCTVDTAAIDPSSESTDWTVYDYNPSNQEIAPRNSPNSTPATTADGGVPGCFPFCPVGTQRSSPLRIGT